VVDTCPFSYSSAWNTACADCSRLVYSENVLHAPEGFRLYVLIKLFAAFARKSVRWRAISHQEDRLPLVSRKTVYHCLSTSCHAKLSATVCLFRPLSDHVRVRTGWPHSWERPGSRASRRCPFPHGRIFPTPLSRSGIESPRRNHVFTICSCRGGGRRHHQDRESRDSCASVS
jgi:hypothetical protein